VRHGLRYFQVCCGIPWYLSARVHRWLQRVIWTDGVWRCLHCLRSHGCNLRHGWHLRSELQSSSVSISWPCSSYGRQDCGWQGQWLGLENCWDVLCGADCRWSGCWVYVHSLLLGVHQSGSQKKDMEFLQVFARSCTPSCSALWCSMLRLPRM